MLGPEKKKPLPSYEELRDRAEVDMLKLGSYLKGKTDYEIEEKIKNKHVDKADSEKQNPPIPVLPLLDNYAQGALRRRIVHDQLDRV